MLKKRVKAEQESIAAERAEEERQAAEAKRIAEERTKLT